MTCRMPRRDDGLSSSSTTAPPSKTKLHTMTMSPSYLVAFFTLLASCCCSVVQSFAPSSTAPRRKVAPTAISSSPSSLKRCRATTTLYSSSEAALPMPLEEGEEDDDEMEWVEEEFELLTERDFYNTEWKIGTLMESKPREPSSIDTTWVRLVTTEDGTNKAIWGDDSQGTWTIDVPSQFFSISKETFGGWFGKQIWAGTVDDFYYLEGTVRGWSPISPASVVGQWQATRLGVVDGERVTEEERGVAPWFMEPEEVEGESESENEGTEEREVNESKEDVVSETKENEDSVKE
mmetsp:Transcript_24715/g.42286  ORF Transcript_24715/g.42286 Transcript_24715/m.42286 type:complete len:292 (-) Transcript_24715:168-1043(-)